jgi:ribosomal protein S18 acetylase RimI-like enzyme
MAEPARVPPSQLTIRRATAADAAVAREITDLAYARYVPLLGRKPQPMTADHQALIAEHEVWLLIDEDAVLGVLELICEPACTLIYSVAVRPEHHRRGLGRMLLDWAERQTAAAGRDQIRLYTNALMEDNLRLYARFGYTETRRELYLGSTLVHMAKHVANVSSAD